MPVIEIAQHWVDELVELQQDSTVVGIDDVVNAALQQYMFRQRQEKIGREQRWYEAHHHELIQQYRGQYIAIHNGRVIDTEHDGQTLSRRIRQQHGRMAIAIIYVADAPEPPTLYIRTPKVATL